MTPIEIFEYKQRWMATGFNHPVAYHSDYRARATDWCKTQLHKCQWSQKTFTDVYEDTMYFEFKQDSQSFEKYMKSLRGEK